MINKFESDTNTNGDDDAASGNKIFRFRDGKGERRSCGMCRDEKRENAHSTTACARYLQPPDCRAIPRRRRSYLICAEKCERRRRRQRRPTPCRLARRRAMIYDLICRRTAAAAAASTQRVASYARSSPPPPPPPPPPSPLYHL